MMARNASADGTRQPQITDEGYPELDWAVVESLVNAQSNTNTSLERYLLSVTHDEFDMDADRIDHCLGEAIEHHERAVADLRAARELIELKDAE